MRELNEWGKLGAPNSVASDRLWVLSLTSRELGADQSLRRATISARYSRLSYTASFHSNERITPSTV